MRFFREFFKCLKRGWHIKPAFKRAWEVSRNA